MPRRLWRQPATPASLPQLPASQPTLSHLSRSPVTSSAACHTAACNLCATASSTPICRMSLKCTCHCVHEAPESARTLTKWQRDLFSMFPHPNQTYAGRASPASQFSAPRHSDQGSQYVLTDGSPPVKFRPSFLASSVAAGSPAYGGSASEDDRDWADDDLTLTELSLDKKYVDQQMPRPKPQMGKRIVVAAHAHGAQLRSVFQEPLPGLLEGSKAHWLQKEALHKEKHPVGVGLDWSQVLEERAKPKKKLFDAGPNAAPEFTKTLSPSMVRAYAQQELAEMLNSRAALKDELLGVLQTMHKHADTGQLLLANSALEQFKKLQSSLEECKVAECRQQLEQDIEELHRRQQREQEALEHDWDAKFAAFADKCSEITREIEEKWIETEKSLDFDVQAELRPYVPSPALFNMRRGLRTLIKMREFLEAHNYSPLVQKKEVSERTDWAVELQRKIALTLHRKRERKTRKLIKLNKTWEDTRHRMNLTYQRAVQVLNDRFSNVEHALQVRCDQQIRAAVAQVRRTVCDVQIKDEVVVKKVKKDEALQNYRLQISNLAAIESRIRHTFRDIEQVHRMWAGLDNNGNGLVSLAELDAWLPKSFPALSYKLATKAAFNMTVRETVHGDPNYNQKLPFVQKHIVCPLMVNLVYTHRALLAFRLCDSKNVNTIDLKSLQKKAQHIGLDMSKENLAAEFAVVDSDGSGRLHFSEFYPWFVQMNIDHGSYESYRGEDVVPFKRFSMRQEKEETFELSKFLDAQEIAWKQCTVEPAKMTKEWNRLDSNGNGLVSGAEVDTWVQQYHKPLRIRAVIKQAAIQTLQSPDGTVAEYIKRDTFPALLVNFVACMRAWIMFDRLNKSDESVGLKDKRIEYAEFKDGLMNLSHEVTEDIVKLEWALVDSDGKGMVLFNEFSNWYQLKQQTGWFEKWRQDRVHKAAEQKQQDKAAVEAALASRIAQETAEAASRKKSILITPFDWSECTSRAQAKLNQTLEAQFLQVFESSADRSPGEGLQKLWLALDNNGNGLVSKQELIAWTEKKYPMLSIGATNVAFAETLNFDGFGSAFVKRSMFKNLFLRLIVPYLLQQRLNVVVSACVGTKLSTDQLHQMLRRLNSTLSESEIEGAIAGMDTNGNGVVTDQELSAWFVKTEIDIALLDSASFPDAVSGKKDKKKTKEVSTGGAKKPKQRTKAKRCAASGKKLDDGVSDALDSSTCDADASGVEAEQEGGDVHDAESGKFSLEEGSTGSPE